MGSICATGSCLAHRKRVFLQCDGPDVGKWLHLNGFPCSQFPPTEMQLMPVPAPQHECDLCAHDIPHGYTTCPVRL